MHQISGIRKTIIHLWEFFSIFEKENFSSYIDLHMNQFIAENTHTEREVTNFGWFKVEIQHFFSLFLFQFNTNDRRKQSKKKKV